jgi:hypothetical protein
METLITLFSPMLVFVYHCFDRIVINGYISMLSRPEHIVYFFKKVMGVERITKETLSSLTTPYNKKVEKYVNDKGTTMEWAQKGVRKEDYVLMIQFLQIDSPPVAGYSFHIKNKPDILKMEMACIAPINCNSYVWMNR